MRADLEVAAIGQRLLGGSPCAAGWQQPAPDGGLLTIEEVATRLRCDVKAIYSLTRRRRTARGLLPLPHRKVGRKLYFRWSEVREWLDRQPGVALPKKGENDERVV